MAGDGLLNPGPGYGEPLGWACRSASTASRLGMSPMTVLVGAPSGVLLCREQRMSFGSCASPLIYHGSSTDGREAAMLFNSSSTLAEKELMPNIVDLPEPDRGRLARSPLELVVCQVRHERRLVVGEGATALAVHDALGGVGGAYPSIDEVSGAELNVMMGLGIGAPNVRETKTSGWRLTSADGAWVITLMPDNFSLETSSYTSWDDDFAPRLDALIDAVATHVNPTFEQRIGLRYVDRINELGLTHLAAWQPYLRPELLGLALHPQLGPGVRSYQQQVLIELADGVTAGLRHGPVVEPGRDVVDYQLDYDIFRQGGRPFDADAVKAATAQFNISALQLFQATISDALLEELR
jgi:uncharacterized protein (TIGR04255 family)